MQLTEVLTDILNLSLSQAAVPVCFQSTSIVQVPKHSTAVSLNDFHPVALTTSQSALRGWSWLTSKPVYHPHWTPNNSLTARPGVQKMLSPGRLTPLHTKEGPSVSSDSGALQLLHHREHLYQLCHSMVWQLLCL